MQSYYLNSIRIPVPLARIAHLQCGSPVELALEKGNLIVKLTGEPSLSLEERLKMFDPDKHSGEAMVATSQVGAEKF